MNQPKYPALYQIDTRVWLTELSLTREREATLDNMIDTAMEQLQEMGYRLDMQPWQNPNLDRKQIDM
jgi:hypothetical protein